MTKKTFLLAVTALLFFVSAQTVSAAALTYGNGVYTNLCGSNLDASFYSCQAWCDPANGFCSTINPQNSQSQYWVYRWTCNGKLNGCGSGRELLTPTDATKYFSVSQDINGQPTACNQTVQLDVFNKYCDPPDESGNPGPWTCAGSPGLFDPNLKGYMVWYSGTCGASPTPPPACSPSVNAHNPTPANGQANVSLQPTFSWSWDCDPSWVKWADVFLWDCNPTTGPGCSLSKPLSFAHLGPGSTTATLSQFNNLPALTSATTYYWEVIPNSNPTTNNIWNFTTQGCSAQNTTNSYVSLSGGSDPGSSALTVTGSTPVYAKAVNPQGQSPLNLSITPGGTSSLANNTYAQIGDATALTAGPPPGVTHSVTSYVGQTPNFCGQQAQYTCTTVAPAIVPGPPNLADPTKVNWTLGPSQFGIDHCGGNYTANDKITVNLYSGASPDTGVLLGSCPVLSGDGTAAATGCTISYGGTFVNGSSYSYRLTANNDTSQACSTSNNINCTVADTSFVYDTTAVAWFQATNGGVYAGGNLSSKVPLWPVSCTNNTTCYFNLNTGSGLSPYPGIVSYGGTSTPQFGNANQRISTQNWLVNTVSLARNSTYSDFLHQIPVPTVAVLSGADIKDKLDHYNANLQPGADALYLLYDGSGDLNLDQPLIINNTQKLVIYAQSANSASKVDIQQNILTTSPGQGFFALVTSLPVAVEPAVTQINGLIFTDAATSTAFSTLPNSAPYKQLVVSGTVVAARGGISLNRTLSPADNSQSPAELFNFDPSLNFTIPRGLRRLQYQINEVPTTAQ